MRPGTPTQLPELTSEIGDLADHFDELAWWSLSDDAQAQHLPELADDQHHSNTVEVADEHGSREIVRDPAQPCQPSPQEHAPHEEGRVARRGTRVGRIRDHRNQRCSDESRNSPLRPDDQLPREPNRV